MSVAEQRKLPCTQPLTMVRIKQDFCTKNCGQGTCAATPVVGEECFNTRVSCLDPDSYDKTLKEYLLTQPRANLPDDIKMLDCIIGEVDIGVPTITGGQGIGYPSIVKIKVQDLPFHDRDVDPYWRTRPYDGAEQGTWLGKWLARNPYHEGRTIEILEGFISDPWDWDNFETQVYEIKSIDGPHNGIGTITAVDILSRTSPKKVKVPPVSDGVLNADVTDIATSYVLSPAGIGDSDYPASGTLSVGGDYRTFTRVGDVLTVSALPVWGSEAKDHEAGDTVQLCLTWEDVNLLDALNELLLAANIPASWIPYDNGDTGIDEQWDEEKSLWMSHHTITGGLFKPEDANKVLAEWIEQFMFDLIPDAVQQKIFIKALSPEAPGEVKNTLTDGVNLVDGTVKITRDSKKRISSVIVYYKKIDYSKGNDADNFARHPRFINPSAMSDDKYGSDSIKEIHSRWITSDVYAAQLGSRQMARFSDTPPDASFEIPTKDRELISLAGRAALNTRELQGLSGANELTNFQITKIRQKKNKLGYVVSAIHSHFTGNYLFVAQTGTPDYEYATEQQKADNGFVCDNSGVFPDGQTAYQNI